MKRLLFVLIICTIHISLYAQNVYYLKNGIPTKNKQTADFRRVIQEPDEGSELYKIFEFYLDDTPKSEGFLSSFEPNLVYEGLLKLYNKQGVLVEETNYIKNIMVGKRKTFYDNGRIKNELFYDGKLNTEGIKESATYQTILYADSLGNVLVKDGAGYYKSVEKDRSSEGNFLNGYKDGVWKGTLFADSYEETFKDKKLISGIAKLRDGKIVNYTTEDEMPNFKGGIARFYSYLSNKIEYPIEAIKQRMFGRLYVSFTVDKDGSLTDIRFKNSIGKLLDDEVYRVLQKCPKWIPGTQHGIPVRVKYNINVHLTLPR